MKTFFVALMLLTASVAHVASSGAGEVRQTLEGGGVRGWPDT